MLGGAIALVLALLLFRRLVRGWLILLVLVLSGWLAWIALPWTSGAVAKLALSDFQTAAAARLTARLRKVADHAFVMALEKRLPKPVSDDVRIRQLEAECIEVTARQFPDLHSVVLECARVLHLKRVPRVFYEPSVF